jgi:hypothetical protein
VVTCNRHRGRMSDQLFASRFPSFPDRDLVAKPRRWIMNFIFLAAVSAATIGWFWLIAWAAMRLIESVL